MRCYEKIFGTGKNGIVMIYNLGTWQTIESFVSAQSRNPLTRSETLNVRREAAVHRSIRGTPVKAAYYQGMANGMMDIADEYGIPGKRRMNPPKQINPEKTDRHRFT